MYDHKTNQEISELNIYIYTLNKITMVQKVTRYTFIVEQYSHPQLRVWIYSIWQKKHRSTKQKMDKFSHHILFKDKTEYNFFQQDNEPANTANKPVAALHDTSEEWIISHTLWLAHSPNLMPSDYYLRESLKDKAFKINPPTENRPK